MTTTTKSVETLLSLQSFFLRWWWWCWWISNQFDGNLCLFFFWNKKFQFSTWISSGVNLNFNQIPCVVEENSCKFFLLFFCRFKIKKKKLWKMTAMFVILILIFLFRLAFGVGGPFYWCPTRTTTAKILNNRF